MPKQISSYLSSLKFDPKLWNTIQAKYLLNFRLVFLLIISIIAIGLTNYQSIPRRLNPEVKIPIVTIITALPGAHPQDVESLLTEPIEDKVKGVEDLDVMTSVSNQGTSAITLQFLSNVDVDDAQTDVKSLVDSVSLPDDATDPSVTAVDFENTPVWDFIVTGNTDIPSLMKFSNELKDRIEDLQKVDRVTVTGYDTQEITVTVDPIKIKEYNLSPLLLSQAIANAGKAYPAGSIFTNSSTISLSINEQITTVDDIRNMLVRVEGQTLKLGDIAEVSEKSIPNQGTTYFASKQHQPQPAVEFFVYRSDSANIDAAGADVEKVVEETVKEYNNRFEVVNVLNAADEITDQFTDLLHEFGTTILLVFINLLLFLGLRQAFISSLTIPLTFLSAISIINALGLTLNFLTLFAFLIALGLLIDDTIVTVAAMTRYYSTGKFSPAQTGLMVWRDFIVPLWSTTITTIWAFVPLLLASGIIGEFIKPIPIVVTATMLSSTAISVLITIPLMMIVLKPQLPFRIVLLLRIVGALIAAAFIYFLLPKSALLPITILLSVVVILIFLRTRTTLMGYIDRATDRFSWKDGFINRAKHIVDHGVINTETLSYKYMGVIDRILSSASARRNTIIALVVFAVVAYMLVPLGLVVNEFFPKSDQELIYASIELPAGTNIQTARTEGLSLLSDLKHTEGMDFITASIGSGSPSQDFGGGTSGSNIVSYTLHLLPLKERENDSVQISESIRQKFSGYTKGTFTVTELSSGPPAGADVQITVLGNNLQQLEGYSNKIVGYLSKQPSVTNVTSSIKSGTSRLTFVPDNLKMAEYGLTPDAVSLWLRTFGSGFTLDSIKINNTDTDVIFRMGSTNITPEELGTINIPTQTGDTVPLLSLGSFTLQTNPTSITREDGKRTVTVTASSRPGYVLTETNAKLGEFADSLNLPSGYSWKSGGVNEENEKSVQSILQAMLLAALLILVTMVIEFRSFRQALIVILTIPLAIPGVFYIFALTGTPLSFPALIGILALFGIVVTNAIVVVEKINDNRREGMPLKQAIVDAAGSRLEPILLTSITSILGLVPITISDPLWRGLGGAIISGLLFSGMVKLLFVPVIYYIWYKNDEKQEVKAK